jgi:choice-of-anchor A domain-containing protein
MNSTFLKVLSLTALAAGVLVADVPGGGGGGGNPGTPVNVCAYNVFVLGNHTSSYSDIQGATAVGRNATYTGYGLATNLPNNPSANSLVVGGSLSLSNGQLYQGSIVANGNVTLQSASVLNGNVVAGGTISLTNGTINGNNLPYQLNPVPINFTTAAPYLQNASAYYGAIPANGTTVNQWGGLVLTGTSPTLNVFAVPASLLSSVWGVQINVPAGSTVLVNVSGTSATVPNVGCSYSGTDSAHVIYNYYQATTLKIYQGNGTILAPLAAANFPWGVVNGTIVVNSLTGNGQANLSGFVGLLPTLPTSGPLCQ